MRDIQWSSPASVATVTLLPAELSACAIRSDWSFGTTASVDHGLNAVGDVVLHQAAPLTVSRLLEGVSKAGRAAKLRLQDRVAA